MTDRPPPPSNARPWILSETTLHDVRGEAYSMALLPWGATEAHNFHLPYGTDCFEATALAAEAAKLAWEQNTRVIVLPHIPFGVNTQQLDIPLTVNLNPTTQMAVLGDVVDSLAACGMPRLVILNGHGGNEFRPMIRELQRRSPVFICLIDFYRFIDLQPFFDEPGDHAGEMETSLMMHVAPQLVRPLADAGPGAARQFKVRALRDRRAWAPRQWTQVTDDTGVGNPAAATGEKGRVYFGELTRQLAAFFVELATVEPGDMYE
jgi:creatinine amidohydrolase